MDDMIVCFEVIAVRTGIRQTILLKALDSGSSLRDARNDELFMESL